MYRSGEIEGEVLAMHLSHGKAPKNGAYNYFVLPACQREDIENFNPVSRIRIHRNDSDAQIIESLDREGELWVIAYTPGEISLTGIRINADAPGIYLFKRDGEKWIEKDKTLFRI